jgi:hypothetical protein
MLRDFPTLALGMRTVSNPDGSLAETAMVPNADNQVGFRFLAEQGVFEIQIPGRPREPLVFGSVTESVSHHFLGIEPTSSRRLGVQLLRPGAANPLMALSSTSFGNWATADGPSVDGPTVNHLGYFTYGVVSDPVDVATNGVFTYRLVAFARSYPANGEGVGGLVIGNALQLHFDAGAASLTGALEPVLSNPDGNTRLPPVHFVTSEFVAGRTSFSGRIGGADGVDQGWFEGRFTGPGANEIMLRWM